MIMGKDGQVSKIGQGYRFDPIYESTREFLDTAKSIKTEAGMDLLGNPNATLLDESAVETLRNFFVNESCERPDDEGAMISEAEYDEHIEDMQQLFENDMEALKEYAAVATKNPVIGMSLNVHKNILINCPFDKGAIQKVIAAKPKFPVDLEYRYLVTPDGEYIDMWQEQYKITPAIDATVPEVDIEITLPESGSTDLLEKIGASDKDNLSIDTKITEVKVSVTKMVDQSPQTEEVWIKVKNCIFRPGYGDYDRTMTNKIILPKETSEKENGQPATFDVIQGYMENNRVTLSSTKGYIKAVKLRARKDASNGLVDTCSVSWKIKTDVVEIDTAKPFNVTISPEEVKDISALYEINQLTKVMSLIKLSLENYKDDKIKWSLDDSWEMLEDDYKQTMKFDMVPRQGYYDTHISWRNETFMDAMESMVTDMLDAYNDPNMIITIFGRPDLIRKIAPVSWDYKAPSSIGSIPLEYERTVVTNADRVYQFISTRKMNKKYLKGIKDEKDIDENELLVILNPRNTDRIMYRIYDYQMYVSNEIRNAANPTLPAVHAFERWKFYEMQPVQGRVKILNPSGLAA